MTRHVFPWLAAMLLSLATSAGIAAPGVTDTTITLGQSAPLTGPASQQGIEMRDGALAYFDYINGKGGVAGRKIVLKTLDDAANTERAASNTRQLIAQDGVFALFGYVGIEPGSLAHGGTGKPAFFRPADRRRVATHAVPPECFQYPRWQCAGR